MRFIHMEDLKKKRHLPEGVVLVFGFLALILAGSVLLSLPISNNFGSFSISHYFDCLFTAVSCVCVTGLSTVSAASTFTVFGQAVMLLLIQLGGLGFMTMALLVSRVIKRRVTPKEQMIAAQALGFESGENVRKLVYGVIRRALIIETAGALLLMVQMWKYSDGFWKTVWNSVFHSVSAFCNAGFDLFSFKDGSITGMADNPYVLVVIMLLIFLGGIGFMVWDDVINRVKDRCDKLTVYSKVVLLATAVLFITQAVFTFVFEYDNPATLGNLSLPDKIVNSCFHSVSLRTAGFASLSNAAFRDPTKLTGCVMMFIGGCSGSTAGGIKVGTIALILFAVGNYSFGRKNLTIRNRTIDLRTVLRAVSLFFIGLTIVLVFTGIFSAVERKPIIDLLYETASGFGTVGLSADLTPSLTLFTKSMLMLLMFFGRVGILTIMSSFTAKSAENDYGVRYPTAVYYIG